MGGLSAAILLAARGHEVTLLEKEDHVGGKAREVEVDGKPIAAGPTVFTFRDVFEEIFDEAGAVLADAVAISPANVLARHAWDKDGHLDLFADPKASEAAIGDFAGAREARAFRAFRAEAKRIFEVLEAPFLRGDAASTPLAMMARMGPARMGDMLAMRPFDNLWKALGGHFADPRLQQLFGRYATYCGSDPYRSPATLMLIAHTEARGVWLIDGGIHALARAMEELAIKLGVRVRKSAEVAEITLTNGRASGVQLASGEQIASDVIISNADPGAFSSGKFGRQAQRAAARMAPDKRSLSALVWFAHAKATGFDMAHHNVFFSPDYAREFRDIRAGRTPRDPTVYVCAQDRDAAGIALRARDTGDARERIQIIVNAPANGDSHTYSSEEKEQCTSAMRNSLTRCGLELEADMPHQLATPQDWEALFPATGGALYGRASHGWAASFQRQGPRTRIPGLYCVGGATHPAAGVPMAALSGQLVARTIHADLASTSRSRPAAIRGGILTRSARTDSTA